MKNKIEISKIVQQNFKEYFFEKEISCPEFMVIDKVYDLGIGGWYLKARVFGTQDKHYIDFFGVHRMTNSRHERIYNNGEIKPLENMWEFGFRTYENDDKNN